MGWSLIEEGPKYQAREFVCFEVLKVCEQQNEVLFSQMKLFFHIKEATIDYYYFIHSMDTICMFLIEV